MTATAAPIPYGWKAFGVLTAAALGLTVIFGLAIGLQVGGERVATAVDDLGEGIAALIAAAACGLTAWRAAGRTRLGWALLGASAAVWVAGEAVWSVYEVGLGVTVPSPSAADVGFLLAIPLAIAGVLAFWTAPSTARWRPWLDASIIVVSFAFTAWVFGLRHVYADGDNPLQRLTEVAYPIGDLFIATAVVLVIRRATNHGQVQMLLLLVGVAMNAVADSTFAYQGAITAPPGSLGNLLDDGSFVGYLMIALAALWPNSAVEVAARRQEIDPWLIAAPWIALLGVAISAIYLSISGHQTDIVISALGGCLAVLVVTSLILTQRQSLTLLVASRRAQENLAGIIANAPIGISVTNADLKLTSINLRLAEMFGERQDDVPGTSFSSRAAPAGRPDVDRKIRRMIDGEVATVDGENEVVRTDGSRFWVHWTSSAVRTDSGQIDYILTMLEDITSKRQAQEAARANLASMEQVNRLKSQFMRAVSHEFKTALIGIQGFSEYMRDMDELNAADVRSFASDIYNDAERLGRVVNEMLDLDRVETTRGGGLKIEAVDLNKVIKREVADALLCLDGITIATHLDAFMLPVPTDSAKLAEVVHTLLHNAIKYSPDGGTVTISTALAGGQAKVSIADQGVGVRADFDRPLAGGDDIYADNPMRRLISTGLGLGIAREIVEMQGGRIWVDRIEGVGSEFHFSLPMSMVTRAHQAAVAAVTNGEVA